MLYLRDLIVLAALRQGHLQLPLACTRFNRLRPIGLHLSLLHLLGEAYANYAQQRVIENLIEKRKIGKIERCRSPQGQFCDPHVHTVIRRDRARKPWEQTTYVRGLADEDYLWVLHKLRCASSHLPPSRKPFLWSRHSLQVRERECSTPYQSSCTLRALPRSHHTNLLADGLPCLLLPPLSIQSHCYKPPRDHKESRL
jgi:hypothetical protein